MKIILIYVNGGNKKILRVYTIHYTTIATIVYYIYTYILHLYVKNCCDFNKTLKHLFMLIRISTLQVYIYYYYLVKLVIATIVSYTKKNICKR